MKKKKQQKMRRRKRKSSELCRTYQNNNTPKYFRFIPKYLRVTPKYLRFTPKFTANTEMSYATCTLKSTTKVSHQYKIHTEIQIYIENKLNHICIYTQIHWWMILVADFNVQIAFLYRKMFPLKLYFFLLLFLISFFFLVK
ncbi:uncharacterized protein DS421_19g657700 [Arachis hypogaea]|uniref:Uncharacterized protein n=1 Tax=Arachis hypogaea TaxID=3818 RepID=A0A6B9V9T5_ARAHY|nr:uncharacterized protein DS421_19g657700 [Arachis hypogaea]